VHLFSSSMFLLFFCLFFQHKKEKKKKKKNGIRGGIFIFAFFLPDTSVHCALIEYAYI
jgi:hypothetical protein